MKTVVVTHPEFPCAELLDRGSGRARRDAGCLIERCLTTPHSGKTTWEHVFDGVRAVGDRAELLLERLRQPGLPAGRGRARDLGRPAARGGVRRGRDPRDGRRPVAAAGGRRVSAGCSSSGRTRPTSSGAPAARSPSRPRPAARRTCSRSPTASRASRASSGRSPGMTVERVKEVRARRGGAGGGGARRDVRVPRPRRLPARGRPGRARRARRADPRLRAGRAAHAHRPRSVQPGSRGGVRRGRAGARAGRRRRDRERVRRPVPAARAPALRAAPAGALQLHADGLPRHHGRDRAEARGDGGDGGAGSAGRVLRRAGRRGAATTRAGRPATPRSSSRRRSSA